MCFHSISLRLKFPKLFNTGTVSAPGKEIGSNAEFETRSGGAPEFVLKVVKFNKGIP